MSGILPARTRGNRVLAYIGAVLVTLFALSALQLLAAPDHPSASDTDLIVFNIAATSPERLSHLPSEKLEILRNDALRAIKMRGTDQQLAAAAVSKIDKILTEKARK